MTRGPSTWEEYETDGYFWRPEEPDARAYGRLTAKADGVRIELIDAPWNITETERLPVLFGESWGGEALSIPEVFRAGWQGSGDVRVRNRSGWWAHHLIVGRRVQTLSDISGTAWKVAMPLLKWWIQDGDHGFRPLLRLPDDARPAGPSDGMHFDLDGAHLQIHLSVSGSTRDVERRTEVLEIQFDLDEPCTIVEFRRRFVSPLQDFLIFASRRPGEAPRITAFVEPEGAGPTETIRVWFPRQYRLSDPAPLGPQDLLRAAQFSREEFPEWLAAWFAFHEDMAEARGLWFDTIASPALPLGNELLNLVAFAEGYHRQSDRFEQAPFSGEAHEAMVEAMLNALPDETARKQYGGALRYANSRSQGRRLGDLIDRASKVDARLRRRRHRLLSTVMDTRHWLTHWGERGRWVVEDLQLDLAISQVKFVIEANLVLDFFEDEQTAAGLMRESYDGSNLLDRKPEPSAQAIR